MKNVFDVDDPRTWKSIYLPCNMCPVICPVKYFVVTSFDVSCIISTHIYVEGRCNWHKPQCVRCQLSILVYVMCCLFIGKVI